MLFDILVQRTRSINQINYHIIYSKCDITIFVLQNYKKKTNICNFFSLFLKIILSKNIKLFFNNYKN